MYLYSCSDGDHRTLYYAENEADITNPEKNSVYRFDITNPSECSFIVCLIADLVLRNRPDEFLHPHDANQSNLNIEVFRKSIADVLDHKIWSDFILSDDFVNLLKLLGYQLQTRVIDLTPKTMQSVLKELDDKPEFAILSSMLLRSMKKAEYSKEL